MKIKIAAIMLAAAAMFSTACEQHKWDETKQLFKEGKEGEHGKAGAHGEKKAEEARH
jgi:hypothetical protein